MKPAAARGLIAELPQRDETRPDGAQPDEEGAPPAKAPAAGRRRNLHKYLANTLGRDIVGGVYRPGDQLPTEFALRDQLAVSRTALREAYRVLAAKGLITSRPNVGTRVRPRADWNLLDPDVLGWQLEVTPSLDFMTELFDLRLMVEPLAAARAAETGTPELLARIAAAYADMERFKDGAGDLIKADLRFHQAILAASGNALISALGGLINTALVGSFKLSWDGAARMSGQRLLQHKAVLDGISVRRPDAARAAMVELLEVTMMDVRRGLKHRQRNGG